MVSVTASWMKCAAHLRLFIEGGHLSDCRNGGVNAAGHFGQKGRFLLRAGSQESCPAFKTDFVPFERGASSSQ